MNKPTAEERSLEQTSKDLMRPAAKLAVSAPPFLAQRILAQLETNKQQRKQVTWWRWAALLSPAVSLVLVLGLLNFNLSTQDPLSHEEANFTALTDRAYAVRVELEEVETIGAQRVQILLPEGVAFFSRDYPELAEKNSLELELDPSLNLEALPFVISSSHEGIKRVLIRFFDSDSNLVDEKSVSIHFKSSSEAKKKG